MRLTAKQEAFCLAVVSGMSHSDAYRAAYDSKGTNETVHQRGYELSVNSKVVARIAELRAPAIKAVQITLEEHLRDLQELRQAAKEAGQLSAAITAEVARGKASGLYVDRSEISGKDGKPLVESITINLVKPNAG